MSFKRYCKVVIFIQNCGINSEFSERSVCFQKIETMGNTIPRKLRICYPAYFEHVQTHLTKQENFLKSLTMVFLNVKN